MERFESIPLFVLNDRINFS